MQRLGGGGAGQGRTQPPGAGQGGMVVVMAGVAVFFMAVAIAMGMTVVVAFMGMRFGWFRRGPATAAARGGCRSGMRTAGVARVAGLGRGFFRHGRIENLAVT